MGRVRTWLVLGLCLCLGAAACASKKPLAPGSSRPPARVDSRGPGRAVADAAGSMVGARYKYGGASPSTGFDCSGLAWWSHARNGVDIPRVSWQQYQGGRRVGGDLEPGDLVFFRLAEGAKSLHVGVYQGGGKFVHSPKSGSRVRLDRMDNVYWSARFIGARRYAP